MKEKAITENPAQSFMAVDLSIARLRADASTRNLFREILEEHLRLFDFRGGESDGDFAPVVASRIAASIPRSALDAAERGDDLLDHAICEIFLLRIAAQIFEWQHCDRWPVW